MTQGLETKTRLDDLNRSLREIFDSDRLRVAVELLIRKSYNKGMEDVDSSLSVSINLTPNPSTINALSQYTFDNIKGMNQAIADSLRKELVLGLMNGESSAQLKQRVRKVFDVNYVRAQAIARTESHRAYNVGSIEAAQQTGLKLKKQWYNPDPKSDICKALHNHPPIPLNDAFTYDGEKFMAPPGHVNCRSRLVYIQADE